MGRQIRNSITLAAAFALTAFLGQSAPLRAEHETQRNTLSGSAFERMRRYAHELDERAQHANDQAQRDQRGLYRRDAKFLKSVSHFARRADEFHERMDEYRARPWNVDEELRHLLRDARNVQYRIRRARFADGHTRQDWNEVVALLNRMIREYQSDLGYRDDPYRHDDPNPYDGSGRYRNGDEDSYGYPDPHASLPASDLRGLAEELEQRTARAARFAERSGLGNGASAVQHLSEQARSFNSQVERGRLSSSELREQISHLLEDAQSAQNDLARRSASRELRNEWDGIVRVLLRMREVAGA